MPRTRSSTKRNNEEEEVEEVEEVEEEEENMNKEKSKARDKKAKRSVHEEEEEDKEEEVEEKDDDDGDDDNDDDDDDNDDDDDDGDDGDDDDGDDGDEDEKEDEEEPSDPATILVLSNEDKIPTNPPKGLLKLEVPVSPDSIKKVKAFIKKAKSLTHLVVDLEFDNDDGDLYSELFEGLPPITHLTISGHVACVPSGLGQMKSLTHLTVTAEVCDFEDGQIPSLTHLRMEDCHELAGLPENMDGMTSLTHLYLWDCSQVEEFPENFGSLPLTNLVIKQRTPVSLPEDFCDLSKLKHLELEGCQDNLPEEIGRLKSLRHLHIDDYSPSEFPKSLKKLKKLTKFSYIACDTVPKIKDLPPSELLVELGVEIPPQYSKKNIADLRDYIHRAKSLKKLTIHCCTSESDMNISELQLEQLPALTKLTIFGFKKHATADQLPDALKSKSGIDFQFSTCQ